MDYGSGTGSLHCVEGSIAVFYAFVKRVGYFFRGNRGEMNLPSAPGPPRPRTPGDFSHGRKVTKSPLKPTV